MLRDEVSKHYEAGLQDYEMKPKVVEKFKKYKHWSGFNNQIGRYVNQATTELEDESFN